MSFLCDARTWLRRGEKFPITVFCPQRGLNWICAQLWNLGLQIWIPPKGGFNPPLSFQNNLLKLCFAAISGFKHKYENTLLDVFSGGGEFRREMLSLCTIRAGANNSPYPVWKGFVYICETTKAKGWGSVTTYEQEASGLRAAAAAAGGDAGWEGAAEEQGNVGERKRMRDSFSRGKQVGIPLTPRSSNKTCSVRPYSLLYYEYWLWPRVMTR